MLGEEVPRRAPRFCEAKTLLLLSLLLAGAAFLTWPRVSYEEDPSIDMAAVAPTAMKQTMQPARTWQSRAWQPKPQLSQPLSARQPVQALNERSNAEEPSSAFLAKKGRREMFGDISKLAAAFTLAGAVTKEEPASAGVELPPQKPPLERDGRLGVLALAPATAVGWVLFNIAGPALNQLDDMSDVAAAKQAKGAKKTKGKR